MNINDEMSVLLSGIDTILPKKEVLEERIKKSRMKGKRLRIKFGVDPTSSDLHLGHVVILNKLREFQFYGHHIILLIGDFTALIGDPSGRSNKRLPLTSEKIQENMQTYKDQIYKILKKDENLEIQYNSKWYDQFLIRDLIELTSLCSLAQILERDDFRNRYRNYQPISLSEMLYPLIQAYDSVQLKSDLEIGGTDQTFNLLLGREIQKYYKQEQQIVITMPILEGIDGKEKMSKSMKNAIYLKDSSMDMFGKIMSIPDQFLIKYIQLLKPFDSFKREEYERKFLNGDIHPKELKEILAEEIVKMYHNQEKAREARINFEKIFSKKEIPEGIEEFKVKDQVKLLDLICEISDFKIISRTEGRRLIQSGSVYINKKRVIDLDFSEFKNSDILQIGKRRFKKINIE